MVPGERTDLALGFQLTRVTNSGIAFGLFDEGRDALVLAFTVGRPGADPRLVRLRHASGRGCGWASACSAGGALGNLADRIRDGAVTDFIDPPLWPAFNVADIAITVGVVVIALAALAPAPARASPR